MGIGRSPRKLLKAALDPLEMLDEVFARYPDARGELEAEIGAAGIAGVEEARNALRRAVAILDAKRPNQAT